MNMKLRLNPTRAARPLAVTLAFTAGALIAPLSPALAQNQPAPSMQQPAPPPGDQGPIENSEPLTGTMPDAWDSAWDGGTYDRLHYVIGTVASFSNYRLLVARPSGETTQIDLKKGTIIRPTGLDLSPGEHVAVIGYWSKGTFIANRVVLRRA